MSDKSKSRPGSSVQQLEFGGAIGAGFIIVVSHILLYYVYYVLHHNGCSLWFPTSSEELHAGLAQLMSSTAITLKGAAVYFLFIGLQVIFAAVLPGLVLNGRKDDSGHVLQYRCNALAAWYCTWLVYGLLHWTGLLRLTTIYDNLGGSMTTGIIFSDALSLVIYVSAFLTGSTHRMSGKHVYDFFMGGMLHPRIGGIDIKMVAELRVSWFLLFLTTASCAAKQYEKTGVLSWSIICLLIAHGVFANACAKGEHYVPATWDIAYEKFGWMLCFWNIAGIPFLYSMQARYLVEHGAPNLPSWYFFACGVVLLAAYYVWDTSQSQKNHFRLTFSGVNINRQAFPYLPWQWLKNPRYLKTERGTPLLIDGWWRYARKIHYTCEIIMSLIWGLVCGFEHFLPYFYFFFFLTMIIHRYFRDMHACSRRYGKDWDRYLREVPYAFIPGII